MQMTQDSTTAANKLKVGYVPSIEFFKRNTLQHEENLPMNIGVVSFSKILSQNPQMLPLQLKMNYAHLGQQFDLKENQVKTIFSQIVETVINLAKKHENGKITIDMSVGSLKISDKKISFE